MQKCNKCILLIQANTYYFKYYSYNSYYDSYNMHFHITCFR